MSTTETPQGKWPQTLTDEQIATDIYGFNNRARQCRLTAWEKSRLDELISEQNRRREEDQS